VSAPHVGFAGLGAMGAHMARNIHARGLLRAVHNRSAAKAEALAGELGVEAVASPRTGAPLRRDRDLRDRGPGRDRAVRALRGAARPARGDRHLDDRGASAERAAAILRARGADLIDAPVSGGVEGARLGTLSAMAGGEAGTLARVMPVLECLAKRITHMGPVGAGQNTKAVNQVLIAGIAQAVCEGLALGEALGLEAERLLPTLQSGAAACWFLDKRGATMLGDEFKVGFKASLLLKDLGILEQLAARAGLAPA
jgi:3-hydroxyisobutyrate dehydrogenase